MDKVIKENKNESLRKNGFLVRFPKDCKFQGWWVQGIEKSPYVLSQPKCGCLTITFKEIDNMGDGAFIKECENFNELNNRTIIFEDLDVNGVSVCGERYIDCLVTEIHFEPCDYSEDEKKYCKVIFYFEKVFPTIKD